MKCPRCSDDLNKKENEAGIDVDYCSGCHGIWLDRQSLAQALQEKKADLPLSPSDFWKQVGSWKESDICCPGDGMHLRTFVHRGVEVDMCPSCNGLWLDKGEWEKLVEVRHSSSISGTGAAVMAVGGVMLLGGAAALGNSDDPGRRAIVTGNDGQGVMGEVANDVVETAATGFLDGAFNLVGDLFSSALDIF